MSQLFLLLGLWEVYLFPTSNVGEGCVFGLDQGELSLWCRCWCGRFCLLFGHWLPEVDLPKSGRFVSARPRFAGWQCFLVDDFQVVVDISSSSLIGLATQEVFENGDVARVFLTSGEESVKLDLARLVVSLAGRSSSVGDVDGLGGVGGFAEKSDAEVSHHAVDESLAFQCNSILSCLRTHPHMWDVEGETFVGQSGNFHAAAVLALDPVNVLRVIRRIVQVGRGDERTVGVSVGVGHGVGEVLEECWKSV